MGLPRRTRRIHQALRAANGAGCAPSEIKATGLQDSDEEDPVSTNADQATAEYLFGFVALFTIATEIMRRQREDERADAQKNGSKVNDKKA